MVKFSGAGSMTTLGEVVEKVEEMSCNNWDARVAVSDISFDHLARVSIDGQSQPVRPIAQRAIAARLNIPHQYLQKCPKELQAENLNHWITRERNKELFFRFDGGDAVRALFTSRYVPVDNTTVLSRLTNVGYGPDTRVQCALDSNFITLSIPDDSKTFAVNGGDRITPGISVINSEVGLSSLHISAFYLRLVCTNGMISRSEVRSSYRHISEKVLTELPLVLEGLSQGLIKEKDRFRISIASKVSDPISTMKAFNRQFQLSEEEQLAVENSWPLEQGDNIFSVIQTYTRAAQQPGLRAEQVFKLMKTGGDILSLVQ
jgi:uncharacterized protein DUF932